jgi:GNAT superfamily N-acetyltransferase
MITIKEVNTKKALKQFIRFPFSLYKDNPNWVPPLISDEMKTLRKDRNPSFEFCEASYFLAYKEGKIVGRVAAIINRRANEIWNNKLGRFSWMEFIDDDAVSAALLAAAEAWCKERGMTGMEGPMGFTDFDQHGVLVEGFENRPPIISPYTKPYYPAHLERLGYKKEVDWLQYQFNASQPVPEKVDRINALIAKKYNVRTCIFSSKKELVPYVPKLFGLINTAFKVHGFVPFSQKQVQYYIKNYFLFARPELVCFILDEKDDIVGFGVSFPSFSDAFRKAKGRLFPFGWYHILKAFRNYSEIDLYFNGVHPDWQNRGIHSLYYVALNKSYIKHNVRVAISSSQLETNTNAIGIWDNYEKELLFRNRCYIKETI